MYGLNFSNKMVLKVNTIDGTLVSTSQILYRDRGGLLVGARSRLLPWSKAGQSPSGGWGRAGVRSATSTVGTSEGHHHPLSVGLGTVNLAAV